MPALDGTGPLGWVQGQDGDWGYLNLYLDLNLKTIKAKVYIFRVSLDTEYITE